MMSSAALYLLLTGSILSAASGIASRGLGAPGESPSYGVDFWREADGLPQSRIKAIVQTHDGYLWLGTDGGLVRFNGAHFTAFTVQTGSIKDNEVWSLVEDDEGALWIGTYGGGLIPAIVVTAHGPRHLVDHTAYNHYSLLTTIEDNWNRGHLGHAGDTAGGVVPMWKAFTGQH